MYALALLHFWYANVSQLDDVRIHHRNLHEHEIVLYNYFMHSVVRK